MSSSKRAFEAHLEAMKPAPEYPTCPDNKLAADKPKESADE